jgi:hypothetical protein
VRHLRNGFQEAHGWNPEELPLLRKHRDKRVAAKAGRSVDAVRQKREELGTPNPRPHAWEPHELALLDKYHDGVVAARTGRTEWAVYLMRKNGRQRRRRPHLGVDYAGAARHRHGARSAARVVIKT